MSLFWMHICSPECWIHTSSLHRASTLQYNGTLPDAVVILRDQSEGHLLHQMNYTVAQSSVPGRSLNHSAGDVDQMSGLANDYLSSVNHVGLEGRVGLQSIEG